MLLTACGSYEKVKTGRYENDAKDCWIVLEEGMIPDEILLLNIAKKTIKKSNDDFVMLNFITF